MTRSELDPQDAAKGLATLRSFAARMSEILELLDGRQRVTADEKLHLQELFRSLKADLKTEADRSRTTRGEAELNEVERRYVNPAVFQASANNNVAWNSHPINSDWYSELFGARTDLTYFLHELEGQFPDL